MLQPGSLKIVRAHRNGKTNNEKRRMPCRRGHHSAERCTPYTRIYAAEAEVPTCTNSHPNPCFSRSISLAIFGDLPDPAIPSPFRYKPFDSTHSNSCGAKIYWPFTKPLKRVPPPP
jgi:hypothetical protein